MNNLMSGVYDAVTTTLALLGIAAFVAAYAAWFAILPTVGLLYAMGVLS